MAKNSTLIFIILYFVTRSATNHIPVNDQLDQPTHVNLLKIDNHDFSLSDNVEQKISEHHPIHHHRKRHHHGENKLQYFNYCRYIRNEDCDNDKCCHIECAKANIVDHKNVCRHNCVQHCQSYLIEKYNVKIDIIEHPTNDPNPGGVIELQNITDPNTITDQKLCCFIDVPENCRRISQYPYIQCEIKRKSTCGPQCLQKVVDINYQRILYPPTLQQLWPYQLSTYYQPQSLYPNYYYTQQVPDTCDSYSQIPNYQNLYQYPYYQNSYYQTPSYQNMYYQNLFYPNSYYQNSYYQNQHYQHPLYYQYYYPSVQQYPVVTQPATTRPVVTTTESNSGSISERPTDYQNDGESNDLPNEISIKSEDNLPNGVATEAKFE